MEDIRIVINRSSRLIKSISKRILGNDGENLQENLVFSFEDEFVNGQARLEYQLPDDTTGWLALTEGEETYQIPVRNVLMSEGTIYFQLVVTEGTDETSIPLFKSNIFKMKINESLNTVEIEAPDGYASWLDLANTKLNQMDNFDINVSKVGDTATIEVTNRLGETTSASIKDGETGATGPQGIQGVPGYTPVKGVDYYTESEKQEMINYIINDSESEFNQNAVQKTTEFNNNAGSKTLGFNQNATNKTNDFNTNATNKTTTFDNNASAKTTTFNENASSKTTDFNSNVSTKTTDYDSHVASKTTDFDTHASGKVSDYDTNANAKLTEYNSNHTSKLQEYNDNAQDKIDDYDEHVQELNDEIEYLQDQVADLSDNQLIAEEEGTEIYVTDSARARLNDFRFTKESTQDGEPTPDNPVPVEVVEGYENLFDKTNIREGKSISADSGNLYNDVNSFATDYINIHNLQSIYWNGKSSASTSWGCFYDENKQRTEGFNISSQNILIPSGAYYVRFGFKNEYLDTLMISSLQYPYVPYGNNYVDVTVTGKNLFDKNNIIAGKYIDANGNFVNDSNNYIGDFIQINNDFSYYVSGGLGQGMRVAYYDTDKNFISRELFVTSKTITIVNNAKYVRLSSYNSNLDTLQLEKGSVATPYEPYQESIVPIALNGNFIGGKDNNLDELIVDKFGKCYLNKVFNKVVLDGVNNLFTSVGSTNTTGVHRFITADIGSKLSTSNTQVIPAFCNRLISKSLDDTYVKREGFSFSNSTHKISIYIDEISTYTLEQANKWLLTHNLEFYYPLEQQELIDLNYTIDLKTFKGVSNITNSENANMKIRYVQDINTIISEMKNAILEIGGE